MTEELKDLIASVETMLAAIDEMQADNTEDGEAYLGELESIAAYADTQLRAALLKFKGTN